MALAWVRAQEHPHASVSGRCLCPETFAYGYVCVLSLVPGVLFRLGRLPRDLATVQDYANTSVYGYFACVIRPLAPSSA